MANVPAKVAEKCQRSNGCTERLSSVTTAKQFDSIRPFNNIQVRTISSFIYKKLAYKLFGS